MSHRAIIYSPVVSCAAVRSRGRWRLTARRYPLWLSVMAMPPTRQRAILNARSTNSKRGVVRSLSARVSRARSQYRDSIAQAEAVAGSQRRQLLEAGRMCSAFRCLRSLTRVATGHSIGARGGATGSGDSGAGCLCGKVRPALCRRLQLRTIDAAVCAHRADVSHRYSSNVIISLAGRAWRY